MILKMHLRLSMKLKNDKYINNFLEYIEKERNFSKHTIRNYRIDLISFSNFLHTADSNLSILKIDKSFIQEFIKSLSISGLSDKTLQRKVASIKSFFKYLNYVDKVKFNVSKLISSPKISKKLPNLLTILEVEELMKKPDLLTFEGVRDKSILEIFYSTGIRISEIIKIKIIDIEFEKKLIKIYGKGNKERYVILGQEALNSLAEYLKIRAKMMKENHKNGFLYPALSKNNKKYISYKSMYNIVKKYLRKISKNEKLSPHSLRHSFATHLLENGADIMSVKDLLGHEDLSSTQIYTNVSIKKIKEAYNIAHPHAK